MAKLTKMLTSAESLKEKAPGRLAPRPLARWWSLGLFLAAGILVGANSLGLAILPEDAGWQAAALLGTALIATLASLKRELPAQNVLLAAVVIGGLGSGIQVLCATAWLRANAADLSSAGATPAHAVAWWMPLVWIVALLNSRGAARVILRPWRQSTTYGFRLLGLATAMSLLLLVNLETHALKFGLLREQGSPTRLLILALAIPIALALATPALINKKPGTVVPDWGPLIIWAFAEILLSVDALSRHLWLAALANLGLALAVLVAGRLAFWSKEDSTLRSKEAS